MDTVERVRRLKSMLAQIAPGGAIESVHRPERGPAEGLEGLEAMPEADAGVDSALQKLAENREHQLTPAEQYGLEAIVMPTNRPVVFVRGNSYDKVEEPWTGLNDDQVKKRLNPLLPMIGRIEVPHSLLLPYAGTGFVVGKDLLMTNRHVAAIFAQGLGLRIVYHPGDAAINFRRQVDAASDDDSAYLVVQSVEMIHPFWDMALLRVDGLKTPGALKLSIARPEELVGRNIVAIGYPARDDRNDMVLQDRIFGRTYNVKRLQPGTIRPRAEARSFENQVNALTHDSSTLGGNSGSAIIDVDTGEVVALHFAGEYLKANYAVPMYELARDRRVAPKLNFDGSLTPTNDWEPAWQRGGHDEVTASTVRGDAHSIALPSPSASFAAGRSSGLSTTQNIPVRIAVSLGQPSVVSGASASIPAPAISAEEEEGILVDKNYANRPGYDPKFLETIEVPLPRISKKMEADTAEVNTEFRRGGDPFELAYFHYSIYMNKRRRTAWFSAANVDGNHRPDIGKRQGDRWFVDPRLLET